MRTVIVASSLLFVTFDVLCDPPTGDASHRTGATYRIPSAIAADCSKDVTAEINSWLRLVPDGTSVAPVVLMFGRNACYRVDGTLGATYGSIDTAGFQRNYRIYEGNGATIDGHYTLPPEHTNRAGFSFMYGVGLTVRNFTIKGNHLKPCNADPTQSCMIVDGGAGYDARYEFHHGIAFFESTNVAALNNRIYNVYGDGITLAQGASGEHVRGARVEGNTIDGTGRMGIGVTAADSVLIKGNVFDRVSYQVIDLEPEAGNPVSNITISSNIVRRHYLGFIASASGECNERRNFNVEANTMEVSGISTFPPIVFNPNDGSGCTNMSGVTIKGNVLQHGSQGAGRYVNGVNITPYHNASVWVRHATDVRVNDNRIIQGRTDTSAIWMSDLTGFKEVKRNDMHELAYAYNYGGGYDGLELGEYDGSQVDGCGNITLSGANQPQPCP